MHTLESIAQPILFAIGLVLAIQVPFVLISIVVALRERHRRAVYVPIDESEALPSNAYMDLSNDMAGEQGLAYLGVCRAGNDRLYRMRHDAWVSPDGHVFAVVGAGRIAAIPLQATWLTSKLVDGRVLITVDQAGAMAGDLSGMTQWELVANADFSELLARHRRRIEAEITPIEPYCEHDPLGEHIELIAQRAERMVRAGYAQFLDEAHETWRYTTWGALARVWESYRRAFVQILKNRGRRNLARPGDYGYVPSQQGRTRSWLRFVEIGLWVAIFVVGRLSAGNPPRTPAQAAFRALTLLGAFAGLGAIWIWRWRISRGIVDPRKRRRRRIAAAAVACLLLGGCYMVQAYPEDREGVIDGKVLVGGGRLYVVVEGARERRLTSRLSKLLERAGKPAAFRLISLRPTMHILESDGTSVRAAELPPAVSAGEVMPVGQHLYLVSDRDEGEIAEWRDGGPALVAADAQEKIRKGLAGDLEGQCAAQGWQCHSLWGHPDGRLSRTVSLGGREVTLDLEMVRSKVQLLGVLRVRIQVPGARPLVRTFPGAPERGA